MAAAKRRSGTCCRWPPTGSRDHWLTSPCLGKTWPQLPHCMSGRGLPVSVDEIWFISPQLRHTRTSVGRQCSGGGTRTPKTSEQEKQRTVTRSGQVAGAVNSFTVWQPGHSACTSRGSLRTADAAGRLDRDCRRSCPVPRRLCKLTSRRSGDVAVAAPRILAMCVSTSCSNLPFWRGIARSNVSGAS